MDISYIIKNLSEGSVIRDLSITPKKWPALMTELSEICSESHVQEAALDLIEQGSMILRLIEKDQENDDSEDIKPIINSNFNEIESQRILNVLEQDRLNDMKKEKRISLADYHMNLIEWMLYEIIQRDNDNELIQCLKNVSYIKVPFSKLKMKLSIIKYKPPTNNDNVNLSKELMLLIDYFNENPDLTTLLILIKLLLLLAEYEIDICDVDSNNSSREEALSQCATLDTNDFKQISELASKREHVQTFESTPHVIPVNGNFTKLTLNEIHGNANGFIGGVSISADCDAVYYETNVKGKDLSNVRVGWGLCGTEVSKYSEMVGSNKNSWVYEPTSQRLFHDSVVPKVKKNKKNELNAFEKESSDISLGINSIKLSPAENEDSNSKPDDTDSKSKVDPEPKEDVEDNENDKGPSSNIDNFDPSLFDTDKDKNIKSFFKFIREEDELSISKIRKIMVTKGLTFESIEDFFDEELPNDSLLETMLPLEKMDLDPKNDQPLNLEEDSFSSGIKLQRIDMNVPIDHSMKSGSVLGCLLLPKLGEQVFFVDGIIHGCHKIDSNDLNIANGCGWQPVFYSNKSSSLEFNVGQTNFKHRISVLEYLSKHDEVSKDCDVSSVQSHAISSFLRFNNDASNEVDKKGIQIKNLSHDSFKSMTFEASVRVVCNDEDYNSNNKEKSTFDYFTLFSVGEISAPENDCSFNIGLDNSGCVYLEMKNCEIIVSPSCIIPNTWCHIALIYNYHRGSNRSNISVLVNGVLKFQHEIVASKKNKITKLTCKDLCIGHLLPSNSSVHQAINSKMALDICHVRVWSTSRGLESIVNTLGRKKILGYDSDLMCEMTFDEGSGPYVYDIARHKSALRRREVPEISNFCYWLILPKEESDSCIFDILHHNNRSHEKQEIPSEIEPLGNILLNNLLSAIVKKLELTCSKLIDDKSSDIFSTRKFQALSSGGNYFVNFDEVDLWLISSLFRQIISIEKNYLHTSLLKSICRALFKVLRVVFVSICENKEFKQSVYSQINEQTRDHWINKLTISLVYFSSGYKSNVYDHDFIDITEEAISLLISGLDILIPRPDNQFYLLECLLIKQLQSKNEMRTKLHYDIFNCLSSNLDVANVRINSISDPLLLILSISSESSNKLIIKLCESILKSKGLYGIVKSNLRSVIEPTNKNLFQIKSGYTPIVDKRIQICVGDIVIRGPNWIYDDEDGGIGGLGVIIDISDWIDADNSKITVLWKNGTKNNYRWGVHEDQKEYYDICIYTSSSEKDAKSPSSPPSKNSSSNIDNGNNRKDVSFTVEDVRDALIEEKGDTSITKRSILTYMKDNSSVEWQEKNKILRSINSLLVKLNEKEIVSTYSLFYETYSNKFVGSNLFTKDLSTIHKIECRSELLKSGDIYRQRINYFFWILTMFTQESKDMGYDGPMRLLITGQAIILGISTNSVDKLNLNSFIDKDTLSESIFINDTFDSQEGRTYYWNWKNGLIQDKSLLTLVPLSEGVKADELKEKNLMNNANTSKSENILHDLNIDSNYIGGNLLVTTRAKSVEIIQSGDREWNTCICTTAIYPNTGIHKWYVKIKNFTERRGHCMLGVATSEFSYDEFLGQDSESWGLSPNLDLFHGGRKRRNDEEVKLAVGCTVEVTLDSDKGLLEFRELNSSPYKEKATLSFDNLKDYIVFPAFSLYSPGDCIAIVTNLDDINGLLNCKKGTSSSFSSKKAKSYTMLRPKNIGLPSKLIIEYAISMIAFVVAVPVDLADDLLSFQSPFYRAIFYCVMNLLSSLARWQFTSNYKDQDLFNSISGLIIRLNEIITKFRETFYDAIKSPEKSNSESEFEKMLVQCACIASVVYSKLLKTFIISDNPLVPNDELAAAEILEKNKIQPSILSISPSQFLKNNSNQDLNTMWIKSVIFSKGYLDCDALLNNNFAKGVLQLHSDVLIFLKWLSLHDKTHQNLRRFGGDLFYYTVRLLFLVNVYHSGYILVTSNICNKIREYFANFKEVSDELLLTFKPPQFLITCWEYSVKIRLWAKEKVSMGLSYEYLSQYVNSRCQFLLHFESSCVEKYCDSEIPFTQLLSTFNWDMNTLALIESRLVDVTKTVKTFITDNSSLIYLHQAVIKMNLVAERRIFGFKSIRYMLDNISQDFIGFKCFLLNELPSALKKDQQSSSNTTISNTQSNLLLGHYTNQLYAISKQLKLELQGAFDLLYNCLAQELLLCNSNNEDNITIRLTLVDCLSIRIFEEDHTMLSRIQLFFILQEILEVCQNNSSPLKVIDDHNGDASRPILGSPKSSIDYQKVVVKAIMKLFILIALQVATVRDIDDSPRFNSSISSQLLNPSIKKTKSGPATLSQAVFDILYIQLNEISTKFYSSIITSSTSSQYFIPSLKLSQNSLLIASEATNLLLCVSKNKICQQILIQSKWILLLLQMSLLGISFCQQRALLLLSDLLPLVDIKTEDVELSTWFSSQTIVGPVNAIGEGGLTCSKPFIIVKIIMTVISNILMRKDLLILVILSDKTDFFKEIGDSSLPVISEAIGLIRTLYMDESWRPLIDSTLVESIEKYLSNSVPSKKESCEYESLVSVVLILGGYIDVPYLLSPVIYQCGGNDEIDCRMGVLSDYQDYTERVEISCYDVTNCLENKPDILADTLDKVKAINRYPFEKLFFSEKIIDALIRLLKVLLIRKHIVIKEDDIDSERCNFTKDLKSFIVTSCLKIFSSLSNDRTSMSRIIAELSKNNEAQEYSSNSFMMELIKYSTEKSRAGGLSDISVYEEYLMILMRGRQKLLATDKQSQYLSSKDADPSIVLKLKLDQLEGEKDKLNSNFSIAAFPKPQEISTRGSENKLAIEPNNDENIPTSIESKFEDSESEPLLSNPVIQTNENKITDTSFVFTDYAQLDNSNNNNYLVESLENMGFPRKYCEIALDMCGDDPEEALNYILNNGITLEEMVQMESNNNKSTDTKKSSDCFEKRIIDDGSGDTIMHYDGHCNKLLPFFSEPSLSSERLGCIYPGDDINVIETVDPNADVQNMWYKLAFRDFDDGSYQNSNSNLFVYAPRYIKAREVIKDGPFQGDSECILADPPGDTVYMEKYYKIIGGNGALVREGPEISSPEVCSIKTGDIVFAIEEVFNSEGTLRLRLSKPVAGYISKLVGLVEKAAVTINDKVSNNDQKDVNTKSFSEKDLLQKVEDNFDVFTGTDAYNKDERYFGSLQGNQYSKFFDIAKTISQSIYHRRMRISDCGTYTNYLRCCNGRKLQNVDDLISKTFDILQILYCRKFLLSLFLNEMSQEAGKSKELLISTVRSCLSHSYVSNKDQNSEDNQVASAKLDASSVDDNPTIAAKKFYTFIRFLSFRGEPYGYTGLELAPYNKLTSTTLVNFSLSIEQNLDKILISLIKGCPDDTSMLISFRSHLIKLCIYSVMRNIRLACSNKYSDYCWSDSSFEEDIDFDIEDHPNLNYSSWLTDLLVNTSIDEHVIYSLAESWIVSLRGSSISQKHISLNNLANILSKIISSKELNHLLGRLLNLLPLERLKRMCTRRLWMEMEDHPLYSRFLQSIINLLSLINKCIAMEALVAASKQVDKSGLMDESVKLRSVLSFNNDNSHVQFNPQRDQTGAWTLELWLYKRDVDISENLLSSTDITTETLRPMYLLSSNKYFIKLQHGGNIYSNSKLNDPLQPSDPVHDEAYCLSLGQMGSVEKVVDCRLPTNKWVHLAIVNQISPVSCITVYVDGEEVDNLSYSMNLPISVFGSQQSNLSFRGDVAHFRVWSTSKSVGEIKRDMFLDLQNQKHLIVTLKFLEGSGDMIHDSSGHINYCKLVNCDWSLKSPPNLIADTVNTFIRSELEDSVQMFDSDHYQDSSIYELTGYIKINTIYGLDAEFNADIGEVVVLCYRFVSTTDESHNRNIEGYISWCERGSRSSIIGVINTFQNSINFSTISKSVLFGPPETLEWLQTFTCKGSIMDSTIKGSITLNVFAKAPPSLDKGNVRVDKFSLKKNISHSTELSRSYGKRIEKLTFLSNSLEDGEYVTTIEVFPYKNQKDESDKGNYGIVESEGCLWIEFLIVNSVSSCISFGVCTENSLSHPDSCIDGNDGTWTFTISGQASHGFDLRQCEGASDGDVIALHIDSDNRTVSFFKNNTLIVDFDLNFETESLGLRPFVSLFSSGDSVSLIGLKEGPIDIIYPDSDSASKDSDRSKLLCELNKGTFNGFGLLTLKNSEKWFGNWVDGFQDGIQLLVTDYFDNDEFKRESLINGDLISNDEIVSAETSASNTSVVDANVSPVIQIYKSGKLEELNAGDSISIEDIKYLKLAIIDFMKSRIKKSIKDEVDANSIINPINAEMNNPFQSIESQPSPLTLENKINIRVHDGGLDEFIFRIPKNILFQKVIDAYASRKSIPISSLVFKHKDIVLSGMNTVDTYDLDENSIVFVSIKSITTDDLVAIDQFINDSTAPYILKIKYEAGATVRNGIEIEESSSIRTLRFGEIIEAFKKSHTIEKIGRYQIADGWISEKLRGGSEAKVVQILKEKFKVPFYYKVVRSDGAKIRSSALLDSEDIGFCPINTVIVVDEIRYIEMKGGEEPLQRVNIVSPSEHKGWVSLKDHILEQVFDEKLLPEDYNFIDPAVQVELERREKVRLKRRVRASQLTNSKRINARRHLQQTTGLIEVSSDTFFLLKKSKLEKTHSRISSDFTTVTGDEVNSGRSLVFGNKGFSRGIHYWEVDVKAASWGSVFIGVAPEDASSWNGYGFLNYRATQAFGSETLYGSYFSVNDKVGVLLNMNNGTLTFFKDGEDFNVGKTTVVNMGVAYHNVRKTSNKLGALFPCLGVKSSSDQLSISKCHWVSSKGLNPESLMSRVINSMYYIETWNNSYRINHSDNLSGDLVIYMYKVYEQWKNKDISIVSSRPGIDVILDTSVSAIRKAAGVIAIKYDLKVGHIVKTPYGEGKVIGAREFQLWYAVKTMEHGKWYWNKDELESLINSGAVSFEADNSDNKEIINNPESLEYLSFEQFSEVLSKIKFTKEEDEKICVLINSLAHKYDISPLRISAADIQDYISSANILTNRSFVEVQIRYISLCVLNKAASIVLPLVDFNRADFRLPTVQSERKGLNLENDPLVDIKFNSLSGTAISLTSVKNIIFTQTKLKLWNHAIKETTTQTSAPPDEYERPDDLREITINRIEARNIESIKDGLSFDDKLKLSVFGQLRNNMNIWDERSLRRAYIHMQDAGQARAFFVKFSGEGVDDQGGPYRAVFQTAVEEAIGLLELLVPCPNSKSETGDNRDKFFLNLSLKSNTKVYTSILTFFGKLIGIACRHNIMLPLALPKLIWKPLVGESVDLNDLKSVDINTLNSINSMSSGDFSEEQILDLLVQALNDVVSFSNQPTAIKLKFYDFVNQVKSSDKDEMHSMLDIMKFLILSLHMQSQSDALKYLYKGISSVIPMELMNIFTSDELESILCGEVEVDINVLKKATVYESVSANDSHIQFFWESLELLSKEERSQFINFCSGRSRLPAAASEFPMSFKLISPPSYAEKNPDNYLPIARTCFFTLSLPKYSSVEICLEKLKYAIKNTELMDADFIDRRGTSGWENIR